jgi:hypothetical protein
MAKSLRSNKKETTFKVPQMSILCMGKFPILLHKVLSLSIQVVLLKYNLSHQGGCPKTLKVLKDFDKLEVQALFGGLVNKNGYKYILCGDLELIVRIKNLWMVLN